MKEKRCPKCGEIIIGYPALSREDNKTKICTDCALKEAAEAMDEFLRTMYKGE